MGVNCLNFMNQEAIDRAKRENNEQLGIKLNTEGTNNCGWCLGHPFMGDYRICYRPRLEVRAYGNTIAVFDLLEQDFAKSSDGVVLTRDTLPSARRLMAGVERALPVPAQEKCRIPPECKKNTDG